MIFTAMLFTCKCTTNHNYREQKHSALAGRYQWVYSFCQSKTMHSPPIWNDYFPGEPGFSSSIVSEFFGDNRQFYWSHAFAITEPAASASQHRRKKAATVTALTTCTTATHQYFNHIWCQVAPMHTSIFVFPLNGISIGSAILQGSITHVTNSQQ